MEPIVRDEVTRAIAKFHELAHRWERETRHLSLRTHEHAAYREIVSMGWPVLPLLLNELRVRPNWWFAALHEITGADPAASEHAGKLAELAGDWLRWGEEHGYA